MLIITVGIYAAVSLSSDKISYKDTTVKDSLDNLFNESLAGKNLIVKSLSDNGLNLNNESSYSEIVNVINESYTNINNGKLLLAEAITNKGVETSETDDFSTMATKIDNIITKSDRDFTIVVAVNSQAGIRNTALTQTYVAGNISNEFTIQRKNGEMSISHSDSSWKLVGSYIYTFSFVMNASSLTIISFTWDE